MQHYSSTRCISLALLIVSITTILQSSTTHIHIHVHAFHVLTRGTAKKTLTQYSSNKLFGQQQHTSSHSSSSSSIQGFIGASCIALSTLFLPCPCQCPHQYNAYATDADSHSTIVKNTGSLRTWQLPNGPVQLSDPLTSFPDLQLEDPVLLGSGGGGAVFSTRSRAKTGMATATATATATADTSTSNSRRSINKNGIGDDHDDHDHDHQQSYSNVLDDSDSAQIAIKVSWTRSTTSVQNECKILQTLSNRDRKTRHVETCLAMEPYPTDSHRVMIALQPVVDDSVAAVSLLDKGTYVQQNAVKCIVQTMVDMLVANIVTTDVQPLINKNTGEVLFIDMTEAQMIMSNPPSFLDLALVSSFCTEMAALIPEELQDVASMEMLKELKDADSRGDLSSSSSIFVDGKVYDILLNQAVFMNEDVEAFINSKLGLV